MKNIELGRQMEKDRFWMQRALALADAARLTSPPNPWVGCVIVKGQVVIGEGWTQAPGQAHAEVVALRNAGKAAQGSTAYVTLEPCSHHGRTPPCVDALIHAGVSCVCIGVEDPDPQVSGNGVRALIAAGIQVRSGIEETAVKNSLAPYLMHRKQGRCFCVAKAAISIDGRMAAEDGSSQWISTIEARRDAHQLRATSQAILVGTGTALFDAPSLTVREVDQKPLHAPLRVVLDPSGKVSAEGALADRTLAPTLIVVGSDCDSPRLKKWEDEGAEVLKVALREGRIPFLPLFQALADRGVLQVLVEGGPTVLGQLWQDGLMDRLITYVGPRLLGEKGEALLRNVSVSTIAEAPILHLRQVHQLGQTVRMEYSCHDC